MRESSIRSLSYKSLKTAESTGYVNQQEIMILLSKRIVVLLSLLLLMVVLVSLECCER